VDKFPCINETKTFDDDGFLVLNINATAEFGLTFDEMIGRGLVLVNTDSADVLPLGVSIIKATDGQPTPNTAARDVIAVCQDETQFVSMFMTDYINSPDQLTVWYNPRTQKGYDYNQDSSFNLKAQIETDGY